VLAEPTDKTLTPAPGPETAQNGDRRPRRAARLDPTINGHMNEGRLCPSFQRSNRPFHGTHRRRNALMSPQRAAATSQSRAYPLSGRGKQATRITESTTQCFGNGAGKKLHLFHNMPQGRQAAGHGEHMLLHVSLQTRRTAPPQSPVAETLTRLRGFIRPTCARGQRKLAKSLCFLNIHAHGQNRHADRA